eukprot:340954_1
MRYFNRVLYLEVMNQLRHRNEMDKVSKIEMKRYFLQIQIKRKGIKSHCIETQKSMEIVNLFSSGSLVGCIIIFGVFPFQYSPLLFLTIQPIHYFFTLMFILTIHILNL